MAAKAQPQRLVAVTSFVVQTGEREDGTPELVIFHAGLSQLLADDPIVRGREHLFAPAGAGAAYGESSDRK